MQIFYFDTVKGLSIKKCKLFSGRDKLKLKNSTGKEFDTVKIFIAINTKTSLGMANMYFEQIKEYLKSNRVKLYDSTQNLGYCDVGVFEIRLP